MQSRLGTGLIRIQSSPMPRSTYCVGSHRAGVVVLRTEDGRSFQSTAPRIIIEEELAQCVGCICVVG